MDECVFCKIVSGDNPSYTLFEDESVKVLLDAFPNSTGHTLIIPKMHYKDLDDIPMQILSHIMEIAKKIKPLLQDKLNPESIVLVQNNGKEQKIKHFHLHLIPKFKNNNSMSVKEVYDLLKEEN